MASMSTSGATTPSWRWAPPLQHPMCPSHGDNVIAVGERETPQSPLFCAAVCADLDCEWRVQWTEQS